jgi:tRNA nucleotidyltransferase (CCA-adding enzyme)
MTITAPPEHIVHILKTLASEGHAAYLVGGCVRDAVMVRQIHDWDLATSAAPVDVARLFPKAVLTGEKFGTVTIVLPECSVEVTTFRKEGDYHDGRRPENVKFVSSLDEDLSRRDFTINAMAESVDGELIDPFGGVEDIKAKIIRCVGGPNTRFTEDALRMFRALRFSAQLDFEIEHDTLQAIYSNAGMAVKISAERIRDELKKTLLSQRPEIAGEMIKIGLLDRYMALSGKNPEGLENLKRLPAEPMLRWCAFCAILLENHYIRSATEILHNLHLDGKTIKTCLRALAVDIFPDERIEIKRLLSKNDICSVRCAAAASVVKGGESALKSTDEVISSGECVTIERLAVTGRDLIDLGHPQGPGLGDTLNKLLDYVLANPDGNNREALLALVDKNKICYDCKNEQ